MPKLTQTMPKLTQTKIKRNYDTWTKQLSTKIKINIAKHISKLKPKVDQCNTIATTLMGVKRSQYDAPINSLGVESTRPW